LLGVTVVALFGDDHTVGRIVLGVTVAIAVAGSLQLAWAWAGGGPLEQEFKRLREVIEEEVGRLGDAVQNLRSANEVMADLTTAGIERVYPERSTPWVRLRAEWCKAVASANEIDLLGLTLYGLWFEHPELCDALEQAAADKKKKVRVLTVTSPEAKEQFPSSLEERMRQPGEASMAQRLPTLLRETYEVLEELTEVSKYHRVATTSPYSSIVRFDDYVFVAPYMASVEGNNSLAFEARGRDRKAFKLYAHEFETIWKTSKPPPNLSE
jgi:hypothetical protein